MIDRRTALAGLVVATAWIPGRPAAAVDDVHARLAEIEKRSGGRLGVAAYDTGSGARIGYRADERFPMCSTFKLLLAAAVLSRVDRGVERLERQISYGRGDLLEHAPVTAAHVQAGRLPVGTLCAAAVEESDNTAANLLLDSIGGPAGYTGFVRTLGDDRTRLDRRELALNSAIPDDPRDTTTPSAMILSMERVLVGPALSASSRNKLQGWLVADKTGDHRLRAGVPTDWVVGDKTGTGVRDSINDLAILWPPRRKPILVACYCTGSTLPQDRLEATHVEVARLIASRFSPG